MENKFIELNQDELINTDGGNFVAGIVGAIVYYVADEVVKEQTGKSIAAHACDAWASYNKWHPLGDPKYK